MPQATNIDQRRFFPVTVTTPSRGTTQHRVLGFTQRSVIQAAMQFRRPWGHDTTEEATIVVGDPE